MSERIGDWMSTAHGRIFWPLDPRPDEVHIDDIAHHLAHECRYTGAPRWHYSVAQHSVYVSLLVPPEFALWGLLHDAAEAYCKDLPRPLKNWPALAAVYKPIERRVMDAVCDHFGLPRDEPPEVKLADDRVLLAEKRDIIEKPPLPWRERGIEPMPTRIDRMEPEEARDFFIARFVELWHRDVDAALGAPR